MSAAVACHLETNSMDSRTGSYCDQVNALNGMIVSSSRVDAISEAVEMVS